MASSRWGAFAHARNGADLKRSSAGRSIPLSVAQLVAGVGGIVFDAYLRHSLTIVVLSYIAIAAGLSGLLPQARRSSSSRTKSGKSQ